jgi:hypothetical protein
MRPDKNFRCLAMLFLLVLKGPSIDAEPPPDSTPGELLGRSDLEPGVLCTMLAMIQPGQILDIEAAGMFFRGELWDPTTPRCEYDVQPVVFVEFSPELTFERSLQDLLGRTMPSLIAYKGELHGPAIFGPDDLSANPMIAYTWRNAGRGYGHRKMRVKLVISKIHKDLSDPPEFPGDFQSWCGACEPLIRGMEMPRYQYQAWHAGLEGEVTIEVTLVKGIVKEMGLVSGDRLLAQAAFDNLKSWQLDPKRSDTLKVTYSYHLELRRTDDHREPRIILDLPGRIEIWAAKNGWH